MSQTTATGAGAAAPGWYTDPHDPRQLRWWSGEGWTEHVSGGAPQAAAQSSATAAAQPVVQPAAVQPAVVQPAVEQPVAVQQVAPAAVQPVVVGQTDPLAPLPSRRALREPATEAALAASEAAEAALHAQAQRAEQQAQLESQRLAPASQPAQTPQPLAPSQPVEHFSPAQTSAPVPTLPVAPTSFLEQQGYAPLDSTPAAPSTWGQPASTLPPVEPVQPLLPADAVQPVAPVETTQPNAWNQPVPGELPPVAVPGAPVEAAQPTAWGQPAQPAGWGATTAPAQGIDHLFGGEAADPSAATDANGNQWGLSPSGAEGSSRRDTAAVSGSSSLWAWLIAISPILAAGSIAYVLLATKSTLTAWPFEAAVAAPYLLVLLFALADRAALLNLGHQEPRSPAWALLSAPIYLIQRAAETRREDGSGTVLTLVWFGSFILAVVGIVGYGLLTHHALISGLPT